MSTVLTDTEAKTIIGENVSRFLAARGWSQAKLAVETKENEMTISRVVRGKNVPGAGLLSRIAEALNVSTEDLLRAPERKSRRTA
jgi:transcriptional regulator with XRE-family HTH domain